MINQELSQSDLRKPGKIDGRSSKPGNHAPASNLGKKCSAAAPNAVTGSHQPAEELAKLIHEVKRCTSEGEGEGSHAEDYTSKAVPASKRQHPATMGLLWITMVTGFPSVLAGFDWFKNGLSLPQVIGSAALSCLILMLYFVPSCWLGARSGLSYTLLSRKVFGSRGSWLVSMNLACFCMAWYGLTAVFLAEGLKGLYQIPVSTFALSVGLAVLMAFNNFFGFSGVANFARYLAGPTLVGWVLFTFFKVTNECPQAVWSVPSHITDPNSFMLVSAFILGYSVWGNEADYWRYSNPKKLNIFVPLLVAVAIGEFLFPITGWLLAYLTGVTDFAAATNLMNRYGFGGISIIAALVLTITFVAVNDSSLYGAINALQNVKRMTHRKTAALLAIAGGITAGVLSCNPNNFADVASLSSIFLPSATIVMMGEFFLLKKRLFSELKEGVLSAETTVRWAPILAVLAGCTVGLITTGILPGTKSLHVGIPPLQAWITSILTYMLLTRLEDRKKKNSVSLPACTNQ